MYQNEVKGWKDIDLNGIVCMDLKESVHGS